MSEEVPHALEVYTREAPELPYQPGDTRPIARQQACEFSETPCKISMCTRILMEKRDMIFFTFLRGSILKQV